MKKNFVALDTLRTILAVGVALGHYFYWNNTPTLFPQSFFLAVDFFFVLSGFVITQSVLADKAGDTDQFIRKFFLRRIFRLWPLYSVLFIAASSVLIFEFGRDVDPVYYFITSFFLLQSIGFDAGAKHIFQATTIGIAWSISVEFWVGLIYFPIIFSCRRRLTLVAMSCGVIAIFALLILVNFSPLALNVNLQRVGVIFTLGSVRGVLGFALGTLAFLFYKNIEKYRISAKTATFIEIFLIGVLCSLYARNGYNHQNDYVAPMIFAASIVTVAVGVGALSRFLSASIFHAFRPLSYSIYLIHPFYIYAWGFFRIPYNHELALLYIFLVVSSAVILYAVVEKPSIALGKRVVSHLRDRDQLFQPTSLSINSQIFAASLTQEVDDTAANPPSTSCSLNDLEA